jgi:hypothetical protein
MEFENFIKNVRLVRFLARERKRDRNPQENLPLRVEANNEGLERRWDQRRRRDEPMRDRDYHQNPRNQDVISKIHTISGGLAGGEESNSTRKDHTRKVNVEEVILLERPKTRNWWFYHSLKNMQRGFQCPTMMH